MNIDMKTAELLTTLKAIISFLSVLLAFSILLLFSKYQDSIVNSDNLQLFMVLVVVALSFILGLVYLVNNSQHVVKKVAKKASKSSRKKK